MTRFGIWILFGFWILIFGFPAAAGVIDPLRIGGGARPIAMGRTSTAAPGRLDAIYGNPANSADLIGFGLNSMQVKVAEDVNYTLVGMGVPTKLGIVSIGYLGSIVSGINQTAKTNNRVVSTGTFDYSSSVISLGLARPLSSKLSFGSTLKMYSRSFGGIAGGSASGLGFDIGTLMKLRKNLSLGLSLQNLLPSTLSQLTWTNGTKEELPATFRAGIAFSPKSNLLVALDLSTFTDSPSELRSGIEWQVNHFLALRGGIEYLPSGGLGYRTNPTLGIGLIKRNIGFDYAYYSDGTLAANSTHYFSLSFKFAQKASYSPQKAKTKTVKAVKTEQIGLLEKEQELIRQIESYITLLREKVKAAKVSAQKDKIRELIEFERVKMIAAYKNILLKRKIIPPKDDQAEIEQIEKYIELLQQKVGTAQSYNKKQQVRQLIGYERAKLIKTFRNIFNIEKTTPEGWEELTSGEQKSIKRIKKYIYLLQTKLSKTKSPHKQTKIKKLISFEKVKLGLIYKGREALQTTSNPDKIK